jgi:hypothetical protein
LRKVSGLYRTTRTKIMLSEYMYMFVITLPHFSGYAARSNSSLPISHFPWVFHFPLQWKGQAYGWGEFCAISGWYSHHQTH